MKKQIVMLIVLMLINKFMWACDVCEQQQPKITQGITHGTGPQSNWDWVIIGAVAALTLVTLILSIKYLVKPGEKNDYHIKQTILTNFEDAR
ncbi:MAG TPA: hypothetical protein VFM99_08655 [Chitinophagales bacterium]|nr:hypothetical protein [Chitinophagales bacterium]